MATQLEIDANDMVLLEEWSKDPKRPQEERDMLVAMLKWAKSQASSSGDWIYSWMR